MKGGEFLATTKQKIKVQEVVINEGGVIIKSKTNLVEERIGLIRENTYGSLMKIIEYNSNSDIWVQFDKGKPVHTAWRPFCKGEVKYLYDKRVYNVAYLGEGDYKTSINGRKTPPYNTWISMLQRCYSEKFHKQRNTYRDCTVSEEWLNFQNFAKWYDDNFYEITNEKMCLDKDILVKGNKVYSQETCVFVPNNINCLFIKQDPSRGSLPIGVHYEKQTKKFKAQCNYFGNKTLGRFDTPEEAFHVYKIFKEQLIKQIAEKHKDIIPVKLYEAMLSYVVEITD